MIFTIMQIFFVLNTVINSVLAIFALVCKGVGFLIVWANMRLGVEGLEKALKESRGCFIPNTNWKHWSTLDIWWERRWQWVEKPLLAWGQVIDLTNVWPEEIYLNDFLAMQRQVKSKMLAKKWGDLLKHSDFRGGQEIVWLFVISCALHVDVKPCICKNLVGWFIAWNRCNYSIYWDTVSEVLWLKFNTTRCFKSEFGMPLCDFCDSKSLVVVSVCELLFFSGNLWKGDPTSV